MTEENKSLERVSLGIAAMYSVLWLYSLFLQDRLIIDPLYKNIFSFVVLYGIGLALFLLIIKDIPSIDISRKKVEIRTILKCFLLQFTALLVSAVLTFVFVYMHNSEINPLMNSLNPLMLFILLIFNPIAEELVFRGLFAVKILKYGELFYILVSSICFSLVHLVSLGIPQMVYTFILGLIWSYIYVKSGNLILVIALHSLSNFFGAVMLETLQGLPKELLIIYLALVLIFSIIGLIWTIVSRKDIVLDNGKTVLKDTLRDIFRNRGVQIYTLVTIVVSILKRIY